MSNDGLRLAGSYLLGLLFIWRLEPEELIASCRQLASHDEWTPEEQKDFRTGRYRPTSGRLLPIVGFSETMVPKRFQQTRTGGCAHRALYGSPMGSKSATEAIVRMPRTVSSASSCGRLASMD
jgi:hypothetical protein